MKKGVAPSVEAGQKDTRTQVQGEESEKNGRILCYIYYRDGDSRKLSATELDFGVQHGARF